MPKSNQITGTRPRQLSIVVTSAGRRVGLLKCFREAAQKLDTELKIIACDMRPELSAACTMADHSFGVPRVDADSYIDALHCIAKEHRAALLIPTIDPELLPLARARWQFMETGTRVAISPAHVIELVRDKHATMHLLEKAAIPVPTTMSFEHVKANPLRVRWPQFMKPSDGSASRGIRKINSPQELPESVDEPTILQAYLEGPEFTVNMFIDRAGKLQCVVPHERLSVRSGEVEKGRTIRDPNLISIARKIAAALPDATGVLCFQVIRDATQGDRVIEINGRFGGGYPLADYAGATFAQWLLEDALDLPSTANDNWRDHVTMMRYDAASFVG